MRNMNKECGENSEGQEASCAFSAPAYVLMKISPNQNNAVGAFFSEEDIENNDG